MFPYSHNPVFLQLVIQGSPADAEYTGGKGAVVAGLPKYPKYLLLLLFRTDNHISQFHVLIQIQFLQIFVGVFNITEDLCNPFRPQKRIQLFPFLYG